MELKLQQRKDVLEVERNNIIALAREVIIFSEETTSFDGEVITRDGIPYSVEMISHLINEWKSYCEKPIVAPEKVTTEIDKINAPKYQRLEEMIEKYQQEEAEIIKLEEIENRPDYIKGLIKAGAIYDDGKTVIKTLEEVATFLGDNKNKYKYLVASEQFFREIFRKPNGKAFGTLTCKKAVSVFNQQ